MIKNDLDNDLDTTLKDLSVLLGNFKLDNEEIEEAFNSVNELKKKRNIE